MFGLEIGSCPYWWSLPLVMIGLCFFMMRKKGGSMCGFGSRRTESRPIGSSESARGILDKKFALGEIHEEAYEEKKRR